jgi:hypothetical protein
MSWGDEMEDILSEQQGNYGFSPDHAEAYERSLIQTRNADVTRLKQEKNDLHGALIRLLARPRCGACRKAAQAVADRIKLEA